MSLASDPKALWEQSFAEAIARGAYNTSPVEALVRTVSYHLRDHYPQPELLAGLRFLEMGCGAGPNLVWLAEKGIRVSGVDIARNALELARVNLARHGLEGKVDALTEASVTSTGLPEASFDGILESCVFQHLTRDDRRAAFAEVGRLLKKGGVFVGHMLDRGHTTFVTRSAEQLADDPGSLYLADGGSKVHLTNIGLAHFFDRAELMELLAGFSTVDPCLTTYYLPKSEARRRGYDEYLQSMWTVFAVK